MQYNRQPQKRVRDFVVIGTPRSGTHMLASALDSHPDIRCLDFQEYLPVDWLGGGEGPVVGEILHDLAGLKNITVPADKIIILVRNPSHVFLSRKKMYAGSVAHIVRDGKVERVREDFPLIPTMAIAQEVSRMKDYARENNLLVVSYEELCGGKDVEGINFQVVPKLCDCLGVPRKQLTTITEKLPVDK